MQRADGVAQRRLHVGSFRPGRSHGLLHVPGIIQRIKNADDIDPVAHRPLDKLSHYVVGVVAVANYILAA